MRILAPAGTFVAVVATVAAVSLANGGTGGHAPRTLQLADRAAPDAALPPSSGSADYRLAGSLPTGTPVDAPAWNLPPGPADAGLVARLANALHAGPPVREGKGWRAGGLVVSGERGQSWYWSQCGPDTAVSSGGSGSSGSTASGIGCAIEPPVQKSTPVALAVVRQGAQPVLSALGLDVNSVTVTSGRYGGGAAYSPRLEGLATIGATTRVEVNHQGSVTSASGWLATPVKADSYPLISASDALAVLPSRPRILSCRVGPDGKGCLQPPPAQITGAHLGLSMQPLVDGGQMLVPSWLFDVKGSAEPVAQVAVVRRYLGAPAAQEGGSGKTVR